MIPPRLLSLALATCLGAIVLAACGGESGSGAAHPLEDVAASPVVREAWEAQKMLLAGSAPPAPHEDEVRLYFRLRNLMDDPRQREDASARFLATWTAAPSHPLWIDFAVMKRRSLGHPDEVAALLAAGAGRDTTAAIHEFTRARLAWGRDRANPELFLDAVEAAAPGSLLRVLAQTRAARTEQAADRIDDALDRLASILPAAWDLGGTALAAATWQDLSLVARQTGRLNDALLAAHAAKVCARATGMGYLDVRAGLAVGRVHLTRCEYRAALDTFAACRQVAADSGYYRWSKDAPGLMAQAARATGDTELEWMSLLAVHGTAAAATDTNGLVRVRIALGGVERRRGHWEEAEFLFNEAYAADAAGLDGRLRPLIDLEYANLLDQRGDYAAAESLVTAGLALGEDPAQLSVALEAAIRLIRQGLETGRPGLAYRALAVARSLDPDSAPRSAALDPVLQLEAVAARLHARQGEHHLAAAALDRARERRDQASPDAAWYLAEAEGLVALAAEDRETARASFTTCEGLALEVGNPNTVRRCRVQLGAILLADGAPAAAESLFAGDLEAPEYWTRLNARLLSGMCRSRAGDPAAANLFFAGVDSLLGPDAPRDLLARLRLEQARVLAALGDPTAAADRLALARAIRSAATGDVQTDVGRSFNARIEREIVEETLILLDEHPGLPAVAEGPGDGTRRLLAWSRGAAAPPRHDGPLVEFFVGERRAYAWVTPDHDSPPFRWEVMDRKRLAELVEAVLVDMSYPGRAVDGTAAAELGALLLEPALPFWAEGAVLGIKADGLLHGLPWPALVLPEGEVALEHGPLVVVTDGPVSSRDGSPGDALLVLGTNSDTDRSTRRDLDRAESEAAAVAAAWPGEVDLRLGGDVRWTDLRGGRAAGYRAIHIATHTRVYEGLDGRSSIHMAGTDSEVPLTLDEVSNLGADADLLYLSSCEGARRHRAAGQGTTSFAEAFLAGGAGSVVASSVLVDDVAASVLAQAFYRHWLEGKERAAALRAALLEVRDADPRWKHPFYWAFTCLYLSGG